MRPGFTCTAEITTATRKNVVAVPIPAVAVRELIYDAKGQIVKQPRDEKARAPAPTPAAAPAELEAGTDAQRNRRRLRHPRRPGGIRADQDRHRGRPVLRSAVGHQGRRPGHHRPVQQRARHGRWRSGAGADQPAANARLGRRPATAKRREQVSRRGGHRAERHLGGQASLADDGARQHRRRHVDHRRRVAHSGAQRLGQARRSSTRPAPIPSSFSSSASCAATKSGCKVQSNPRITSLDADAVRRHSPLVSAVMLRLERERADDLPLCVDRRHRRSRGVTQEYVNFSSYDAERGRLMSPTEVAVGRPVAVLGAQTAERLFGPDIDPLDKTIQIRGRAFPRRRRQRQARDAARPVAGRVRRHSAQAVSADVRIAAAADDVGEAARPQPDRRRRSTTRRSRCGLRGG